MKGRCNIDDLFKNTTLNNTYLNVCAPMVRYSKAQFRNLVRK